MKPIYFDYAATTPCDPEVVAAMLPYFSDRFGNPSSMHAFGQETKGAVEEARERIAAFLGAAPGEIVFTSGGTESNNMAVKGVAYTRRGKGNHIITSRIEHHAVLEPCHF
ncbi:MAG TPA: aminotransferase class V-fold PLP-dependent enzyme, partial [Syntrophales bacterium]